MILTIPRRPKLYGKANTPQAKRLLRHVRVRKKVFGTAERPRLSVFRSPQHIYAQVIDDAAGRTLVAAADTDAGVKESRKGKNKTQVARLVGALVAQSAKEAGVTRIVFDRGGYKYHGRVKALAEAAREGGLVF